MVVEGSTVNPGSPVNLSLSTRRNDIDHVVITSTAPFWIDDLQYDYAGNVDPYAILDADSYTRSVGVTITFNASTSYDTDSLEFFWSFDDGATWTFPSSDPIFTYTLLDIKINDTYYAREKSL